MSQQPARYVADGGRARAVLGAAGRAAAGHGRGDRGGDRHALRCHHDRSLGARLLGPLGRGAAGHRRQPHQHTGPSSAFVAS